MATASSQSLILKPKIHHYGVYEAGIIFSLFLKLRADGNAVFLLVIVQ
jgi:hypothetical protein